MKNFSDLLDTKPNLTAVVDLKIHGNVEYYADINLKRIIDNARFTLDLTSPIDFYIELQKFDEGTSGIEIVEFSIDGLEILPLYRHHANPPTHYIDQLGIWRLTISEPFYQWYHKVSGQGWLLEPL